MEGLEKVRSPPWARGKAQVRQRQRATPSPPPVDRQRADAPGTRLAARTGRSLHVPAPGFPRPRGGAGRGSRRGSGGRTNSRGHRQAQPRVPARPATEGSAVAGPRVGQHVVARRRHRAPSSPMGPQRPLPAAAAAAAAALLWGFLLPLVRGAGGRSGLPGAGPGLPSLPLPFLLPIPGPPPGLSSAGGSGVPSLPLPSYYCLSFQPLLFHPLRAALPQPHSFTLKPPEVTAPKKALCLRSPFCYTDLDASL